MLTNYKVDIQYNLKELEAEFFEAVKVLKEFQLIDSEEYLYQALKAGKKILAEGAQGSMLDIDFGIRCQLPPPGRVLPPYPGALLCYDELLLSPEPFLRSKI